ncbi:MAG: cupin domain-containing protein [Ignavibacteria bacterium]
MKNNKPKSSKENPHKISFSDLSYDFENTGGTVKMARQESFPMLTGSSLYLLNLKPGGLRTPHWHPNCAELGYITKGTAEYAIVSNYGEKDGPFTAKAGDAVFIPKAYFHYIKNTGEDDLEIIIFFNDEKPEDIGLNEASAILSDDVMSQTFDIRDKNIFSDFNKDGDLIIGKK